MDGTAHLLGLGKIVGNLHSLELLLRIFLCEESGQTSQLPNSTTGTVPETFLTNFMSLGDLVQAYNAKLAAPESRFSVDVNVVKIRDAIAHGRLLSAAEAFPLTLYRFRRPQGGAVAIEFAETISEQWLDEKRSLICEQIKKVIECAGGKQFKSIGR